MEPLILAPDPNNTQPSQSCSTRSRAGCRQCRQRKKKCNEQRPRCSACAVRNLPCNWSRGPRGPPAARRDLRQNNDFALPQAMRLLVSVFVTPTATVQERLLSHFDSNGPLWLTSVGNADGSSKLVIPVAIRCPAVLNCILTVAAGDLSKYQPASSEMRSLTCGFYGQAVASIRSAIDSQISSSGSRNAQPRREDLLLAIILLCVHEIVNFSAPGRIIPHLNAAAALCHDCGDGSIVSDPHLQGLMFEVFYYIFTLTAFSHGHSLPLQVASKIFTSSLLSEDHCKGVLLGRRCRRIFQVILQMSILKSSGDEAIETELKIFEAQLYDQPIHSGKNIENDCTDEVTSELYRLACLIYIKKTLNASLPDSSAAVQTLLEQFISILNTLPPESPANNILCWPLFVAGMSSILPYHQRLIVGRLRRNYNSWWRSDILSKTADFLSRSWRSRTALDSQNMTSKDINGHGWVEYGRQGFELPFVLV
uniref:Zn(2)-C6 fungal-type domain-containing protein n=2 Tax=Bionectria ochroleuca TaxID=29856 RepID=A0A0B7JZE8_BIOOC